MATMQERYDDIELLARTLGLIKDGSSPLECAEAMDRILDEGDHQVDAMATTMLHRLGAGDHYPAAA